MKISSTKIKQPTLEDIFVRYNRDDLECFRKYCISVVENARAPNHGMMIQMKTMTKNQLVKSISNFAMKGWGLGVK